MSVRIFKYTLQPERRQLVQMPRNAKPLYVGEQQEQLVMWAEVPQQDEWTEAHEIQRELVEMLDTEYTDPYQVVPRVFTVLTTGDAFEEMGKTYIGTTILKGWYVAHVYEQAPGYVDPIDDRNAADLVALRAEQKT